MLTWNSSDIGHYHPLIQQKRLDTGKAAGSVPQTIYQYRGVPFSNRTWGLLNVTGIAEGVAFGNALDSSKTQIAWDSVLNRPVSMAYTGELIVFCVVHEKKRRKKSSVSNYCDLQCR